MVRFVNVALISVVVPAAALQESTSGHDVTLRRRELGAADLDVDVSPKQVGKIALGAAAGAGIFKAGEFLRDALTVDSESAESVDTTTTTKAPSPSPTAPPASPYDLVADNFVGYPHDFVNYTNMLAWTVSMDFASEDATVGTYEWDLGNSSCVSNDTKANSCGVHVHFGSSCKYAWLIGGHSFNTTDPWGSISYNQSMGSATVNSGVKAFYQKTDSNVDALIENVDDLKAGLNDTQIDQTEAVVQGALTSACIEMPKNFTELNDCLLGENSTVAQATALAQLPLGQIIQGLSGANPRLVAFYVNVVLAAWDLLPFNGEAFKLFWESEPVWETSGVFVVHDKEGVKTHCSNIIVDPASTAAPSAAPSAAPVPAPVF